NRAVWHYRQFQLLPLRAALDGSSLRNWGPFQMLILSMRWSRALHRKGAAHQKRRADEMSRYELLGPHAGQNETGVHLYLVTGNVVISDEASRESPDDIRWNWLCQHPNEQMRLVAPARKRKEI